MKSLILSIIIIIFLGCNLNEPEVKELRKTSNYDIITGQIIICGNEPFTWVGIDDSNYIYRVFATQEIINELIGRQGGSATLEGTISDFGEIKKIEVVRLL